MAKPLTSWGSMDPNSSGQLWSRWEFRVYPVKTVPFADVEANAARWIRKGFGTAGQVRISQVIENGKFVTLIEAEVEGVPAHDPDYITSVKRGFRRFVEQGWGLVTLWSVDVKILAGDVQDGKPRAQLVVVPRIQLEV